MRHRLCMRQLSPHEKNQSRRGRCLPLGNKPWCDLASGPSACAPVLAAKPVSKGEGASPRVVREPLPRRVLPMEPGPDSRSPVGLAWRGCPQP